MTRRIVRTVVQLSAFAVIATCLVYFLDNRYRVLPNSIHRHLPAHHDGLVILDVVVKTCGVFSLLTGCSMDPNTWHRIEKDLYLGKAWASSAFVYIERKKEEDLLPGDRVILDIRIGRLDPSHAEQKEGSEQWESRPAGVWLKRTSKRHASDSQKVATAIDVLFGADAVEPRPGWEIRDHPLLLDTSGEMQEARLSIRKGLAPKLDKVVPRINKDGKFKIMQVSDMHLSTGLGICRDAEPPDWNGGKCDADTRTLDFIGRLLDEEKPDMVVLSGDQINGDTSPDSQSAVFKFAELFISRKIPYASIFGNHDDEGSLKRGGLMDLVQSLPYSLSEPGPTNIDGIGNYHVEVLGRGSTHHAALTLYLLDTHGYSPDERQFKGYDWLKQSQIEWFKKTSEGLKKEHAQYSHKHMDLAFIHIPLPEYRQPGMTLVGNWLEPPTAPGFNSGFRNALVEAGVVFVSCGHDHANDYCALSRDPNEKPALWMCYAGGSGFGGYGGYGGYHRRVRFFDIDTNENSINTYKRLEYGDTKSRLDEQTIVEGGRIMDVQS